MRPAGYFDTLGLTPYWFAHVVSNVLDHPAPYLRKLEDIFGDVHGEFLCRPFPRWSHLHIFIESIFEAIMHEDTTEGREIRRDFLRLIGAPQAWQEDLEEEGLGEIAISQLYQDGVDRFTEEVFHILFRDVVLLRKFNLLLSHYIPTIVELIGDGDPRCSSGRKLRRARVPQAIKDAVYHRDGGECRQCKLAIDRIISPIAKEHYDHIVPLARGGANDVTNVQLLCGTCNTKKSANDTPVSSTYPRLYPLS